MNNSFSESYKAAGVDVTAGYKSVELMKKHVARTKIDGVISGIGGFGGLFAPDFKDMEEPVLVSGTDGVGTKIKLAFLLDKHDTIGIDAVAMCVNDVIVTAESVAVEHISLACSCRDEHNRHIAVSADFFAKRKTVHFGEHYIKEQKVIAVLICLIKSL